MDSNVQPTMLGFSLMEVLLALLVVMIGIVAVTGLLGTSLDASTKSHDDLNIVSFADMVFNHCHSVNDWHACPTSGTLLVADYNSGNVALEIGSMGQFTCKVPETDREIYTVSYLLNILEPVSDTIKTLTLDVWPGYSTNSTPRTFYTELYNWTK